MKWQIGWASSLWEMGKALALATGLEGSLFGYILRSRITLLSSIFSPLGLERK